MKKGYKKILVFEYTLIILLYLNSFVSSILKDYGLPIFILISLFLFYKLFGFEKDRNRYSKDIMMEVFIVTMICFIFYYLMGIIVGYARIPNYYNLSSFIKIIIPTIVLVVSKEILRYMIIKKSEGNKIVEINGILFFIMLSIINPIIYSSITTKYDLFIFIALTLLPAISNNIASTYISKKAGYKPTILFQLIINLYSYLIPIIPDFNEYLLSIFLLIVPFIVGYKVFKFYDLEQDKEVERYKPKENKILMGFCITTIVLVIYFTSGYFKYHAVAIASGSMNPVIKKGDIVIIEKLNNKNNKKDLKIGQIIAYKYHNIIVVHRIVEIARLENEKKYYYTKGDANEAIDNYPIEENMILGTVDIKIPLIGLPTVWLNEM